MQQQATSKGLCVGKTHPKMLWFRKLYIHHPPQTYLANDFTGNLNITDFICKVLVDSIARQYTSVHVYSCEDLTFAFQYRNSVHYICIYICDRL